MEKVQAPTAAVVHGEAKAARAAQMSAAASLLTHWQLVNDEAERKILYQITSDSAVAGLVEIEKDEQLCR